MKRDKRSFKRAPRLLLVGMSGAIAIALASCGGSGGSGTGAFSAAASHPNILVIVADDMGYSDIGAFGSEIATPNIDALVRDGRVLTSFHSAPACSPARGMLMTGADSHMAGEGAMENNVTALVSAKDAPFGVDFGYDAVPDGYAGHLNDKAVTMPQLLHDAGYHTYMAGKWHLAYQFSTAAGGSEFRPASFPNKKGFERSFALLDGAGAHFAPIPGKLTRYDKTTYTEDDAPFPATSLPADFYSTKTYTDKLISYIDSNRADGKPFFAYAAYTAPHWPLQAPDADIAAQKGRYDEGYDVIRARRIQKMKQLGVLPQGFVENPGLASVAQGGTGKKRWSELTANERALQARAMEVYAAMVSNLDGNVGRLVQYLRDKGQYDNTVIFFMSDNGADSNPAAGANVTPTTDLASMGRPGSTIAYGERWAEVSSSPFRLWKTFTGAEGAVSVPAIIKLPGQNQARVPLTSRTLVKDLLPTFLDFANIPVPQGTYAGNAIIPITGVSLSSVVESPLPATQVVRSTDTTALEYLGQGYVQRDDGWKLTRTTVPGVPAPTYASVPWQLFNTNDDRGETKDHAAEHPDIVDALKKVWDRYVADNGVLIPATPPAAKRDPAAL
jgi:arylsulfatase A-like enzyme